MAGKNIKEELHKLIEGIDDEAMLLHLLEVLINIRPAAYQSTETNSIVEELREEYSTPHSQNTDAPQSENWWRELSPAYQQELIDGLSEMKDGENTVSHEEAMKRVREWVKR